MLSSIMFNNSSQFFPLIKAKDIVHLALSPYLEYRIATYLNEYGLLVEIVVGSSMNLLALIVMLTLSSVTMCNYMAALAIADLNVLLGPCLTRFLITWNLEQRTSSTGLCRFLQFHCYWSFSVSAWLLVALTIDRYIAVGFPLQARHLSSPTKTRLIILVIAIAAAVVNCHFFFIMHVHTELGIQTCVSYEKYSEFLDDTWPWIDATLYSFLPFLLLIVFNTLVLKSYKGSLLKNKGTDNNEASTNTSNSQADFRLTMSLLTVTVTFMILTGPKALLLIIRRHVFNINLQSHDVDFERLARYTLTYSIVNVLMYANHSINFFLYCLTGRKFRRQVIQIFHRACLLVGKKNIQVAPLPRTERHYHQQHSMSISTVSKSPYSNKAVGKSFIINGQLSNQTKGKRIIVKKITEESTD